MASRRPNAAIARQLRTLYNLGIIRELTDGQLLERFATDADESAELALAALVERHAAMVWRVCLAILGDPHDAEDAFQATFLVLARRARSLWVKDSLGPWLHQVAYRTGSCLRTAKVRRRRLERRHAAWESGRPRETAPPRDHDREAMVHEEVERLPEKYLGPIVLCDLEGRTHYEAAKSLGWPVGTVKSRLSQARSLLRDRLVWRGLGLTITAAILESSRPPARGAIPGQLPRRIVDSAVRSTAQAANAGLVTAEILGITQEVLRAMYWIKVRLPLAATLAVGIALNAAGLRVHGDLAWSSDPEQTTPNRPATPAGTVPPGKLEQTRESPPLVDARRATLRAQQLVTRKAKATYEIARQMSELAEIAIQEFDEVSYPRDLATADGEIKLAQSDLVRAEDRLEWAKRMQAKGYTSKLQTNSEAVNLQKARFGLEQAQTRRNVLERDTRAKTRKKLGGELLKARYEEVARAVAWEREKSRESDLERQLRLPPGGND